MKRGKNNTELLAHPRRLIIVARPSAPLSPSAFSSRLSAFSLVEVVIAIGVAAFCLIALIGLIPMGVKSVKSTYSQTSASELLEAVSLDLRNTPIGSNTTPSYAITLPTFNTPNATANATLYLDENGVTYSSSANLNAQYGATLFLSNSSSYATTAQIQITWPATVPPSSAIGSLETVTTIIRK